MLRVRLEDVPQLLQRFRGRNTQAGERACVQQRTEQKEELSVSHLQLGISRSQ